MNTTLNEVNVPAWSRNRDHGAADRESLLVDGEHLRKPSLGRQKLPCHLRNLRLRPVGLCFTR
jgi:hypothetical protein